MKLSATPPVNICGTVQVLDTLNGDLNVPLRDRKLSFCASAAAGSRLNMRARMIRRMTATLDTTRKASLALS